MIRREGLAAPFVVDGSSRDLYVLDTTAQDWREMFRFVRASGWIRHRAFLDDEVGAQELPEDPSEMLDERVLQTWGLVLDLDGLELTCGVYEPCEIEFYLDPRQLDDARFERLVEFMEGLGRRLKKDVLLTAENRSEEVIARYEVRGDGVRMTPLPTHSRPMLTSSGVCPHFEALR